MAYMFMSFYSSSLSTAFILIAFIIGSIAGILQGSVQGFVFTIHLYHGAVKWILVSVAGWALLILALFTGIKFIGEPEAYRYFGTVPGITTMMAMVLPLSIGQWMVLKESRRAIWWVPANIVGVSLALCAWYASLVFSIGELGFSSFILAGVIASIVYGLPTGWVLQKILQSGEKRA
jgi:hypothetical protein